MQPARAFEGALWASRLVMLVAVAGSALAALGVLWMATVDVAHVLVRLAGYADPALATTTRADLRAQVVAGVVKAVDGYLLAAILLIFAFGLYELFVSRLEAAQDSEVAGRLLLIRSLDDLKDRLAKVVLLILVVKFLQQAVNLDFGTTLELLYLALGILLVAGAVFLSSAKPDKSP